MTYQQIIAIALTAALIALALSAIVHQRRQRLRLRREAQRFRLDPRVGDRAGYQLSVDARRSRWMIGDIVDVKHDDLGVLVDLQVPIGTPFGDTTITRGWAVEHLRWFPAEMPVGVYEEPTR